MVTAAGVNDITVSLLNFCIAVLDESAVEVSSGREIFGIVGTILALVRVCTHSKLICELQLMPNKDTMIDDRYIVHLSKYCFNVCETLKNMIQGRNRSDLNELEKMTLEDLERCVHCL